MAQSNNRILLEPAYVLHQRAYRDSSLLLEVFSYHHGRVGLIARGVKGKNNQHRGLLQPFVPLQLSWSGRGELQTVTDVEAIDSMHQLTGQVLLSGFYLNELLINLLHRHDPHSDLFDYYRYTLKQLDGITDSRNEAWVLQRSLRLFEKQLLQEIGYGLILDYAVDKGKEIEPRALYQYVLGQGPVQAVAETSAVSLFKGSSLLSFAEQRLDDPQSLKDAKHLTRMVLEHYLAGKKLHSRQLLQDLQRTTDTAMMYK